MTRPATCGDELLIQLDVAGLAALMKAVEAAMADGRGHLTLNGLGGMVASCGGRAEPFARVTVTFAGDDGPSDDHWRTPLPAPEPAPQIPVLALKD